MAYGGVLPRHALHGNGPDLEAAIPTCASALMDGAWKAKAVIALGSILQLKIVGLMF